MATNTLTWASSGLGTKTGTTIANLLDDLDTLITSKASDPTFFWQKAGKSSAANPYWLLLSRKDGSAGRIAILGWTTAPTVANNTLYDSIPPANNVWIAWFPNGNANTLSNIQSSTGTICGNDTGACKIMGIGGIASIYASGVAPFYFDSAEAFYLGFGSSSSNTAYVLGAGLLLVEDDTDTGVDATFSTGGTNAIASMGVGTGTAIWLATPSASGILAQGGFRTNYSAANYWLGFAATYSNNWPSQSLGSTSDITADTTAMKVAFIALPQLMGITKLQGPKLSIRQMAVGPVATSAFATYQVSGPVVKARHFNCSSSPGTTMFPWLTNFKLY